MQIKFVEKKLNKIKADAEIIFIVKNNLKHKWIRDSKIFDQENYKGEAEDILYNSQNKRIYVGIDKMAYESLSIASAQAIRVIKKKKIKTVKVGIYSGKDAFNNTKAIVEGSILGAYSFDKYKTKKEKNNIASILISSEEYGDNKIEIEKIKEAIVFGEIIAQSTNLTRDLVNTTPEEINPESLAKEAQKLAKEHKLDFKKYSEDYIKKQGMNAFLAVSKGSPYQPQLIHLTYRSDNPQKRIVLVGKGLTFDSGGLNLKSGEGLINMKSDKSGAAAIFGIMQAASKLKLPIELHGIIGATENVIGHHAFKPGDILTAMNGKTIEVKNTDAEGRLVLADCLVYAQKFRPDYLIDIATLTGACVVALGEYTTGLMGYQKDFTDTILKASENSGELIDDLIFNRYLPKLLKSEVADISNISSSRYGGAITAALFLGEFIEKKYKDKWAHLDIAGPAFATSQWGVNTQGGTGSGVRLVTEWIKNIIK